MICPKCQSEVPDGLLFCPKCGSRVAIIINSQLESLSTSENTSSEKKKRFKEDFFAVKLTFAIIEILFCLTSFIIMASSTFIEEPGYYDFFDAVFEGLVNSIMMVAAFFIIFISLGITNYVLFSNKKKIKLCLIFKITPILMGVFLFLHTLILQCIGYSDILLVFLIFIFLFVLTLIAELILYFHFKKKKTLFR